MKHCEYGPLGLYYKNITDSVLASVLIQAGVFVQASESD
jgi:hypothetical protein